MQVFGDSYLIIQQSNETFRTRDPKLIPYHHKIKDLRAKFEQISFNHIPRAENSFADALATLAAVIQFSDNEKIDRKSVV